MHDAERYASKKYVFSSLCLLTVSACASFMLRRSLIRLWRGRSRLHDSSNSSVSGSGSLKAIIYVLVVVVIVVIGLLLVLALLL